MKKWTQKLIGDIEVNKDITLLLVIGGLYALSIALSNTFVNVFLWKQSEDLIKLSIYNLSAVIMQPITFILAGRWAKKIDRIIVLRLGVISLSCFYLTVLILSDQAGKYLILLGALLGIGYGFYWLSFHVLTFEITEPETRDFFNGFLGLLTSFAGMIGPIFAGFVITYMEDLIGYQVIFSGSLFLFSVAVFLSFFLGRRSAKGEYRLAEGFSYRKEYRHWKNILHANFFQGLREGSFIFVVIVWLYIATGSELAIGTYGLITSFLSFICYFIVGRFLPKTKRKYAVLVGGTILYFAVFIIAFGADFTHLIIYGVFASIAYPLLLVPYLSLTYDVIGSSRDAATMRVEYIVVRELFLNFGRIASILILIVAILGLGEEKGVPIALLFLGLGHFVIYWFIKDISLPESNKKESYSALKKR
ncbi:MFS transporter [Salipaludibacillus sp. CF4.18]|uniref:MFS transporter n=1 Tax=Salipaludibacillus sp. CF4.18 TaxID=3373081 RepID=UPI003EE4B7E9